jgi:hypothetical protein
MSTPIQQLVSLGQSIWYDNIERRLLNNGELAAMIERGDIQGLTSNPSIFNNAIAKSKDYDAALRPLAAAGRPAEQIFEYLAVADIRAAADLLRPLYNATNGGDGYASLEVSPTLAYDTETTADEAKRLWTWVGRPNLMVKIPATREGLPAIQETIAAGMNINVTLIFSIERYQEVMEAYISGLEDRLAMGLPLNTSPRWPLSLSPASIRPSTKNWRKSAPRKPKPCWAKRPSPTPGWPIRLTKKSLAASALPDCRRTARAPSGRCGPPPAPKTRLIAIPSMWMS